MTLQVCLFLLIGDVNDDDDNFRGYCEDEDYVDEEDDDFRGDCENGDDVDDENDDDDCYND